MSLRIRRGTEQERLLTTFALGEPVWTTNNQQLWIGNGVTPGGINIAQNLAGVGLAYNQTTKKLDFAGASYTTDDIAEGTSIGRQYFTAQRAQDAINAAFVAGSIGGVGGTPLGNVVFSYDDTRDLMYANVTPDGVGLTQISQDVSPSLGGNLTLSGHNITGTGNINIAGSITTTTTSVTNQSSIGSPFAGLFGLIDPNQNWIEFNMSRGTLAQPATVHLGDVLSGFLVNGWDGTQYSKAVAICGQIDVNGTVSQGVTPGQFLVVTQSGAPGAVEGDHFSLLFNSLGQLLLENGSAAHPALSFDYDGSRDTGLFHPLDGVVCVASNGVEKARFDGGGLRVDGFVKVKEVSGTLPSPAEAGMIVLDGGVFKGYTGSAWVPLS